HYDWDPDEGYYKLCKPVLTKHYTDTTADISHYNICSQMVLDKCGSYYQTCPAPSESVYEFYWYKKLPECRLRRDFRYFPKNLKLSITDDFSRKVTVTNSSAGTYTDHTTCPQEKKITEQ
ncbi:MAG TPA: hypothetical protein PKN76_07915, partial [bacterium]|nr:hypothetical protein [bacterium]